MARDLSCPSGHVAYKTKRAAETAVPGTTAERCHRCRWWHPRVRKVRKASQKRPGT